LPLFNVLSSPPFHAILVEPWNAPPHRYFLSYRVNGDFRHVMGLPVVDEFATFSSPIFFGPKPFLGQLYNVGITLGHQRHPDMALDQGWPPLCIGFDSEEHPSKGWEDRLLSTIKSAPTTSMKHSSQQIQRHQIGETSILATDLPLLPRHLRRLCQVSTSSLTLAFSTGIRITRPAGEPLSIDVASEAAFEQLLHRISTEPVDS
jgi:hypothetical protein